MAERMLSTLISLIMMILMIQILMRLLEQMQQAFAAITPPPTEEAPPEEVTPEDFTTFTEVDPNDRLTVEAHKVTATNLLRQDEAYLYKDYGADHFTNFEITLKVTITDAPDPHGHLKTLMLCNTPGCDVEDISDFIMIMFGVNYVGNREAAVWKAVGGTATQGTTFTYTVGTPYYLRLKRDGGTVTFEIFSDEAMTNRLFVDTLDVSDVPSGFRYIETAVSRKSSTDGTAKISGIIENLRIIKTG